MIAIATVHGPGGPCYESARRKSNVSNPSTDFDLADALADLLGSCIGGMPIEVVGDYREKRETVTELRVRVMPAGWTQGLSSRKRDLDDRTLHVGVIGPAGAADRAVIEEGLAACDLVREAWGPDGPMRHAVIAGHGWVPPLKQEPLWMPHLLFESPRLFVALIEVTYKQQ